MLFDSNILIDALNGIEAAATRNWRLQTRRRLSVISRIEVLAGCPTLEAENLARALIASMEVSRSYSTRSLSRPSPFAAIHG